MGKDGTELGVELANMWLCGRSYLPNVAEATAGANKSVAGTADDASVFARPGTVPGTPGIQGMVTGDVYPAWNAVRDEFQRILAESADNLYAVGDALVRVAEIYAATDELARDEMNRVRYDYATSGDYRIDDPTVRPPLYPPQ
jgi:hypothetical protein